MVFHLFAPRAVDAQCVLVAAGGDGDGRAVREGAKQPGRGAEAAIAGAEGDGREWGKKKSQCVESTVAGYGVGFV